MTAALQSKGTKPSDSTECIINKIIYVINCN